LDTFPNGRKGALCKVYHRSVTVSKASSEDTACDAEVKRFIGKWEFAHIAQFETMVWPPRAGVPDHHFGYVHPSVVNVRVGLVGGEVIQEKGRPAP